MAVRPSIPVLMIFLASMFSAFAPLAAQEEEPRFRYLSTNFSLTDVSVDRLLNRLARVGVLDSPLRFPADQTVLVDGTIDLGRFGRVVVAGMTVEQVEERVEAIIRAADVKYLDEPLTPERSEINVRLMAPNAAMYYVLGEVNSPGFYPLIGRETALDAILTAGGLSDRASKENIILTRASHPEGCRTVLPICWDQIVQLGDSTTNYQIMPGDRIFVPTETCHEGMHRACCSGKECRTCERCQCTTGSCPPSTPPPTAYGLPMDPPATIPLESAPKPDPIPTPPEPALEK